MVSDLLSQLWLRGWHTLLNRKWSSKGPRPPTAQVGTLKHRSVRHRARDWIGLGGVGKPIEGKQTDGRSKTNVRLLFYRSKVVICCNNLLRTICFIHQKLVFDDPCL